MILQNKESGETIDAEVLSNFELDAKRAKKFNIAFQFKDYRIFIPHGTKKLWGVSPKEAAKNYKLVDSSQEELQRLLMGGYQMEGM